MASHIENATFQYWLSVCSSCAVNSVINSSSGKEQELTKEWFLQHSMEHVTDVVDGTTKKLIVMQEAHQQPNTDYQKWEWHGIKQ